MKILAVTGCENGIAKSKMAAESIEIAAEDTGDEIEVEIQESSAEKELFEEDALGQAEAVIVASELDVDTERFDRITTVHADLRGAITEPESLIAETKDGVEAGKEEFSYESDSRSGSIADRIGRFLP